MINVYLFLVKLARFITQNEQKTLAKDIKSILKSWVTDSRISNDKWAAKNRLIVEIDPKHQNMNNLYPQLLNNPGISSIVLFTPNFFNWEFSSFSSLINEINSYLEANNPEKTFNLDFRNFGKLPFHKKAIIDRLEKKKLKFHLESKFQLYLEIQSGKSQSNKTDQVFQARIGRKITCEPSLKLSQRRFNLKFVIYSPFTTQEIADFFRLSLTFNIPIILTNENGKVHNLIKKVQQTFFKGTTKISYEIIPSIESLVKSKQERIYGFSLWGTKSINELPQIIKSLINRESEKQTIYFMFGNEKKGLPLFIRYLIPTFSIGRQVSEPLRACLAASYALGITYQL